MADVEQKDGYNHHSLPLTHPSPNLHRHLSRIHSPVCQQPYYRLLTHRTQVIHHSQPHIPDKLRQMARVLVWIGDSRRVKRSAGDNEAFLTWSALKK